MSANGGLRRFTILFIASLLPFGTFYADKKYFTKAGLTVPGRLILFKFVDGPVKTTDVEFVGSIGPKGSDAQIGILQ